MNKYDARRTILEHMGLRIKLQEQQEQSAALVERTKQTHKHVVENQHVVEEDPMNDPHFNTVMWNAFRNLSKPKWVFDNPVKRKARVGTFERFGSFGQDILAQIQKEIFFLKIYGNKKKRTRLDNRPTDNEKVSRMLDLIFLWDEELLWEFDVV